MFIFHVYVFFIWSADRPHSYSCASVLTTYTSYLLSVTLGQLHCCLCCSTMCQPCGNDRPNTLWEQCSCVRAAGNIKKINNSVKWHKIKHCNLMLCMLQSVVVQYCVLCVYAFVCFCVGGASGCVCGPYVSSRVVQSEPAPQTVIKPSSPGLEG